MKFKKLEITGFKSFFDKTHFYIENGLTGIVGPNGCGKSNIVEALRWCMGETSAKSMRGSGMEDVIFSGTSNRPSKNIAEVSIQIENADKDGSMQFNELDEITVTRRIQVDKGSKYFINQKEVRAREDWITCYFKTSRTKINTRRGGWYLWNPRKKRGSRS